MFFGLKSAVLAIVLEAVVRIEFDEATADAVLAGHEGTEVDYAVNLWSKDF